MGWGVEDADDEYEAKLAKKMQDEARSKAACQKASADLRKIRNDIQNGTVTALRPELKNDIQNVSKAFDDWSFYDACKSGDSMTVCILLDQCEGDELARRVNAATEDGSTPLFVAAWKGQTRVCKGRPLPLPPAKRVKLGSRPLPRLAGGDREGGRIRESPG